MRSINLNLKIRSYKIIIGSNILPRLGKELRKLNIGQDAYVITNSPVKDKYGQILAKALKGSGFSVRFKVVPDTEESKSLNMAQEIIRGLALYDRQRRLFIVALGGGVVGDLSGFVASVYKRGIPYIQVPTTLLAQVDSAIGGKTAVDLLQGKNLVGAFYQPSLVYSDVKTLLTLSARQVSAGLAEVIKYGIIKDPQLFDYLESKYREIFSFRPRVLEFIIARSSKIKADIVSRDEREEKGLRTVLNFGHTAGHAIEAASYYRIYNHGEAVALGMLVAADISRRIGLISDAALVKIESLIQAVGLPTRIKKVPLSRIINAHYRDKKFIGRKNRLVLIKGIGRTKIVEGIPVAIISQAIKSRLG